MAVVLQRVATLAYRRRRTFIAVWLLLIVAVVGWYVAFGSTINSEFTIPEYRSAVEATLEQAKSAPQVSAVVDREDAAQRGDGDPAPRFGNDGRTAVVSVIPGSGPHDRATTNLVKTIRAQAPAMAAADGAAVSEGRTRPGNRDARRSLPSTRPEAANP